LAKAADSTDLVTSTDELSDRGAWKFNFFECIDTSPNNLEDDLCSTPLEVTLNVKETCRDSPLSDPNLPLSLNKGDSIELDMPSLTKDESNTCP